MGAVKAERGKTEGEAEAEGTPTSSAFPLTSYVFPFLSSSSGRSSAMATRP